MHDLVISVVFAGGNSAEDIHSLSVLEGEIFTLMFNMSVRVSSSDPGILITLADHGKSAVVIISRTGTYEIHIHHKHLKRTLRIYCKKSSDAAVALNPSSEKPVLK